MPILNSFRFNFIALWFNKLKYLSLLESIGGRHIKPITFKDRVFGANVDSDIIKKFKELAGGGFKKEADVNVGLEGGDRDLLADYLAQQQPAFKKYLGDRTTFARMWTAVNVRESGQEDVDSKNTVYNIN